MSRNSVRLAGAALIVVAALAAGLTAGCGGAAAVPTSVPTAAAKAATQPLATTGAAAAATVPAAATAAAPTVSAAATSVAPTAGAVSTAVAPTISAAATSAAPAVGTVSATTAGQLADSGKTVYADSCASCHGAQGQGGTGPAIIGANANLGKYDTAQGLFTKISTTMPRDHPATLTPAQYLQVTAFLLVQNNVVQPTASLSSAALGGVPLKK